MPKPELPYILLENDKGVTNWKEYKSVPCALPFLATRTTKLSNWLIAQDLATGETKSV